MAAPGLVPEQDLLHRSFRLIFLASWRHLTSFLYQPLVPVGKELQGLRQEVGGVVAVLVQVEEVSQVLRAVASVSPGAVWVDLRVEVL